MMAVIRLKGTINVFYKISETLDMLNVRKTNYMTLIPSTSSYLGMLKKSKDFVTWGEINQKALEHVIRKRGELVGRKRINDKYIKENTQYPSITALAKALLSGEITLRDVPDMKRFFRLHPARKGYKAIKKGFADGGDLGYRGEAINELIVRMV
ncbi:MAG: 50S ribosomal protein L30 [Candidatus Heimdallarchaeota archaeon]|nr:50S ribosomal protein L30 [Candidatus Heimdallarchaeota archaeon]MCK4953740.1 50S ribosomal protein L30 [Candidatus Heimdallarchaeota archaeon]